MSAAADTKTDGAVIVTGGLGFIGSFVADAYRFRLRHTIRTQIVRCSK